ncbi:MAG: thiamine pyrophosphate-binding protein [Gammaproteobacteria bacterium]|nr:thiamine pyrophosphate-binding protein [Gammaproteobacteria bacterium]
MHQSLTGGMVVSRALARYGIRTVFSLAGASHTFLLEALQRDGLRIISNRHESGCVSAADGYARVTGRLGVALIIADQGMPNAINGIATAFHACSPVLVLVARLPDSWTEAESEYDNLKHPLVGSISKWARTVPTAERLAEYVDAAAKRALTGRRGPVVLQIPQEFLQAKVADAAASMPPIPQAARPAADSAAILRAAQLLQTAKKPLLIAGAGACHGEASDALRALVERCDLPIAGNGLGRGLVPEDGVRSFSWPFMQLVAREADVVCVIGARLKQRLGYGLPPRFAANAQFIQIDIEAEELSRNRRIDVAIVADAGLACRQLLEALDTQAFDSVAPRASKTVGRATWVREALQARFRYLDTLVDSKISTDVIHPLVLGRAIARRVDAAAIVIGDGADIQNWMYAALPVRQAPGFLDHYPMGAMGVGTPLAVGAAAAAREIAEQTGTQPRQIVMTTGDGAFGFYPAELHAAAQAGLKITCIIGNDGAWGTELHGQTQAIGRTVNTELGFPPYEKVAQGFGCAGLQVSSPAKLEAVLDAAFAHDGTCVVNVIIDRNAGVAIKTEPLAKMILFDDLMSNIKTLA